MFTNFQPESLPTWDDIFGKELTLPQIGAGKFVSRKRRKLAIAFRAWKKRQYFLTAAHRDFLQAAHQNEDIFLGILTVATAISYAYATIAASIFIDIYTMVYTLTAESGIGFILLAMISTGVLGVTSAWVLAFILNSLSIALLHGQTGKKNRSLLSTLRQGLQSATTTTQMWVRILARCSVGIGTALLYALIVVAIVGFKDLALTAALTIPVVMAGLLHSLMTLFRTSLIPSANLFEPTKNYSETTQRSRHLLQKQAKLFLLTFYSSMLLAFGVVALIARVLDAILHINGNITMLVGALAIMIYSRCLLTMLYTKRRRTRA